MSKELIELIESLKVILKDIKEKIDDNGKFDVGDFKDIYEGLILIVAAVTEEGGKFSHLSEADKKAAIAETMNWLINIPWINEEIEGKLFGLLTNLMWFAWEDRKGRITKQ